MVQGARYLLFFVILVSILLSGCNIFEGDPLDSTPIIKRFEAMPNPTKSGGSVMLRWEVKGAESTQIAPEIGSVQKKGFRELRPTVTTRYTLTARAGTSVWSTSIDVVVSGSSQAPEVSVPTPTPSPTTPTPTPRPTPTPSPTPNSYVPPAPGTARCSETVALYEDVVFTATDQVLQEHPEWFDSTIRPPWMIAIEPEKFVQTLIAKINAQPPLKAANGWFDSWAVISVKENNDFSEDYHVLASFYGVRKRYGQTCRPATF
jgi:hypothetical protein